MQSKFKCLVLMGLLVTFTTIAQTESGVSRPVKIASMEKEPYTGINLPDKGYVNELIRAAFAEKGYQVDIGFYPPARAKYLAEVGEVDAVAPVRFDGQDKDILSYSSPFPGAQLGFLKKKQRDIPNSFTAQDSLDDILQQLSPYIFGVVRKVAVSPEFDHSTDLKKVYVTEELRNLDLLAHGRIDIAVIDKYNAADLMVNYRPHLIGQLEFIRPPLFDLSFYLGFSNKKPDHQQLVNSFNQGLVSLINNGGLKRIMEKHGFYRHPPVNKDKQRIVIAAADINDIDLAQALSREYEKQHADIDIEWRILEENTLRKRLLSDFAISDGQFDVAMLGAYETSVWSKKHWLSPINNLPDNYDWQDVFPSVRHSLTYKGQQFALPFIAETDMTFYRKDLFKKAGIQMAARPTYQDILTYAKAIHDPANGVYGIGLRGKPGWGQNMAFVSVLVNAFGGHWFDQNWKPTLTTKAWKNALTYYVDIVKKYGPPDAADNGWQQNQSLFAQGKLGIFIDATSLAGKVFATNTAIDSEQIGYAPAPFVSASHPSHWFWTWAMAIPQSSTHQTAAKDFIAWMTSRQFVELAVAKGNDVTIPSGTRKSTYQTNTMRRLPVNDFIASAIQTLPFGNENDIADQFVAIPEFPAIGYQVGLKVQQILKGQISVEQGLMDSQNIVEHIMQEAGYYSGPSFQH
ncbi:extracellular solute-binding protein [Neptunicella marina]|uniref:Extracellular solute-binding protein n=1 Tax=Neptunicella marina TaxID=2125989 RepID=A0A8J6ISL6_9ALTE|nr:extracellular solute-binding protein [Neptunicella marina]MBC3765539.1 extracellular solute-binding protein [Neptunicella marina]